MISDAESAGAGSSPQWRAAGGGVGVEVKNTKGRVVAGDKDRRRGKAVSKDSCRLRSSRRKFAQSRCGRWTRLPFPLEVELQAAAQLKRQQGAAKSRSSKSKTSQGRPKKAWHGGVELELQMKVQELELVLIKGCTQDCSYSSCRARG